LLFVLVRRLPPRLSPLFPYTTLFRSLLGRVSLLAERALRGDAGCDLLPGLPATVLEVIRVHGGEHRCGAGDIPACKQLAADMTRDRKSTRLNSSHLGTSYAVFCLKKQ